MAETKFIKGSLEFDLFQDYWKMIQKYYITEETEAYWKAVCDDIGNFSKRYEKTSAEELARALALAAMHFFDEKYKKDFNVKNNKTVVEQLLTKVKNAYIDFTKVADDTDIQEVNEIIKTVGLISNATKK